MGSSITQCSATEGPAETWPALVARTNNWDRPEDHRAMAERIRAEFHLLDI